MAVGILSFAAFSTGANLVYLVASLILALFAISLPLSFMASRGLEAALRMPVEGREDEPIPYHILLKNPTSVASLFLKVRPAMGRDRSCPALPVFVLPPGSGEERTGEIKATHRGVLQVEGVEVDCLYPAGLISGRRVLAARSDVIVVPRSLRHGLPVFAGFNHRSRYSETGSNVKGEGSALYGLRKYQIGDPIKKIHWKASARIGEPVTVEEEEDRVNHYYIFVDLRESKKLGHGGECNLEVSIRAAATLSRQLLDLNCPVRIHLMDSEMSPSPHSFSNGDLHRIMRFLGQLRYTPDADFPRAVTRQLQDVPPGSFLIFILPDVDAGSMGLVKSLMGGPYSLFCMFNLPDRDRARAAASDPEVRQLVRRGARTLFLDGQEEKVVSA